MMKKPRMNAKAFSPMISARAVALGGD